MSDSQAKLLSEPCRDERNKFKQMPDSQAKLLAEPGQDERNKYKQMSDSQAKLLSDPGQDGRPLIPILQPDIILPGQGTPLLCDVNSVPGGESYFFGGDQCWLGAAKVSASAAENGNRYLT